MKSNNTKLTEAFARQAESDKLTTQQKLDRLDPNGAKKERAKLTARLASEKQPKSKKNG